MRRLLIVSAFFPPTEGGIERTLSTLAASKDFQVTVLTPPQRGDQDWDRQQLFRIVRQPFFHQRRWPSWLPLTRRITTLVRQERSDLVLFGHYAPYAIVGRLLARQSGVPYAIYAHGFDALAYTERPAHRRLLRNILNGASLVFVNSAWTGRQLTPYVPSWKFGILYPPVDVNRCPASTPPRNHRLFSVGHLRAIKGFDVALKAVARLRQRYSDVSYSIAGFGPEATTLKRLARELGIDAAVRFVDTNQFPNWCPLIEDAAVVLQPSRSIMYSTYIQEESFGIAALEAGATGRPVVASAVGGVPEAIVAGKTGLLVPPDDPTALADAIASLFDDRLYAEQLGQAASDRIRRRFTIDLFHRRFRTMLGDDVFPKVSICIPAWNAAQTLPATLTSLFRQDYPNLEWIVVDDGSTDATAVVALQDPRVKLIRGQHRGASAARNQAAAAATGEYLYFSDADCVHRPRAIGTLVAALRRHPEAAFAYSSFRLGWKLFRLRPFDPWVLRNRNFIPTRALIRRESFPGFDETLKRLQDWDLWLTVTERGGTGVWVDQILYQQIASTRTMSSGWFPKFLYRYPTIADRLSRGAGLTLRAAEDIVRQKHAAARPPLTPLSLNCPRCRLALRSENGQYVCARCRERFHGREGIVDLLHRSQTTDFKRAEIEAHDQSISAGMRPAPRNAYYHRHARRALLDLPLHSRVLEVACGERPDTYEIAGHGREVVAIDIAARRVALARQRAAAIGVGRNMRFFVADAEHLPFPDASFDAAYVAASFHHFPNPRNALHELRRVVQPGGLLILALEPQRWPYRTVFRLLSPLRSFFRRREPAIKHSVGDDTTQGFSRDALLALARNEGLEVVDLRPVKLLTELADQTARLLGKLVSQNWETPRIIQLPLEVVDQLCERLPFIRYFFWHWTLVSRVP